VSEFLSKIKKIVDDLVSVGDASTGSKWNPFLKAFLGTFIESHLLHISIEEVEGLILMQEL